MARLANLTSLPQLRTPKHRRVLLLCLIIFSFAFFVRFLTFQDNRHDVVHVQHSVTNGYKDSARQLVRGDFHGFLSNINHMGHPPGYPLLLAALFKLVGDSNNAIQLVQIFLDSFVPVLIFLIALELVSFPIALITALLSAISPQFSYFPVLLLPDSLVVVPLLLGFYFLLWALRRKSVGLILIAGVMFGLSCWLRANALLLPLFLACFAPLFAERSKRVQAAALLVAGAVLAIAPITVKNAIVFHRFVPLSLGAGQTLLEGLSDYDPQGTLNIPLTDLGIMKQEAEWYGKPEYAQLLFGADGIDRERQRLARGFSVIRTHPFWFMGVAGKRAIASTRLDPVPRLAPESPVGTPSHSTLKWTRSGRELLQSGTAASGISQTQVGDEWLRINGNSSNYGIQIVSEQIEVRGFHDYSFELPLKLEAGRVSAQVLDADQTRVLAATGIDSIEGVTPEDQSPSLVSLPFVSASNTRVRVAIANNAAINSTFLIGQSELYELGPSSQVLLRFVRIPLGVMQRVFTTAWMIPLTLIGLVALIRARKFQEIALLLAIPAYYLSVQSVLHTERRYVYVIHFFFLIFISAGICWLWGLVARLLRAVKNGGIHFNR